MKQIITGEIIRIHEVPVNSLVLFELNNDVFKWGIPVHVPFNKFIVVAFGGSYVPNMLGGDETLTWDEIINTPAKNKYLFDNFEELCKFIYEKI